MLLEEHVEVTPSPHSLTSHWVDFELPLLLASNYPNSFKASQHAHNE